MANFKPLLASEVGPDMIVFLGFQRQVDGSMLRVMVECPGCQEKRWVRVNSFRRGKIRTTFCQLCSARRRKPTLKKGWWLTNGYKEISYSALSPELREVAVQYFGVKRSYYEHRLVALIKYGAAAAVHKTVVRHEDGNKLNNTPDNLILGSQKQNIQDHMTDRRDARLWKAMAFWAFEQLCIGLSTNDEDQDPHYFGAA